MSAKGCSGFFYFVYILSYLQKIKKRIGFYKLPESRFFTSLFITQDVNEIKKKNHEQPDFFKYETCVKFQHKIYKLYGG